MKTGRSTYRWASALLAGALGLGLIAVALAVPSQAQASVAAVHVTEAQQSAAPENLQIAMGNSAFAPISTQALFNDNTRLVPGDAKSASFRVRNASDQASLLTLALTDAKGSDPTLMESMTVGAFVPGQIPSSVTLSRGAAGCPTLIQDEPIAAGSQLLITVTVSLLDTVTGMQAQKDHASFNFIAGLRSAVGGTSAPSLCASGSTRPVVERVPPQHPHPGLPPFPRGPLADTGSDVLPYLLFASVLVGAGAVLLLARRRRDRHTEGNPPEG